VIFSHLRSRRLGALRNRVASKYTRKFFKLGEKSLKEEVVGKAMLEVQNDDKTLPNFTERKSKSPSCRR